MKKSRILAGIWMLFLVVAYLVSASITCLLYTSDAADE